MSFSWAKQSESGECSVCKVPTDGGCKQCAFRMCLHCYNTCHGPVQCNAAQKHDANEKHATAPAFLLPQANGPIGLAHPSPNPTMPGASSTVLRNTCQIEDSMARPCHCDACQTEVQGGGFSVCKRCLEIARRSQSRIEPLSFRIEPPLSRIELLTIMTPKE